MSKQPLKSTVMVTGLAAVRQELRQIGERAVDHAPRQMRQAAEKIAEKAKEYVPEDSTALKESIRVVENKGARNRLEFDVIVGGAVASWQWYDTKSKDVDIDQYAWIIHENYESMQPGKKTIAKMERIGRDKVGSGFLRRAADEERESLRKQLFDGFDRVVLGSKRYKE